jgi:hypothetical protein
MSNYTYAYFKRETRYAQFGSNVGCWSKRATRLAAASQIEPPTYLLRTGIDSFGIELSSGPLSIADEVSNKPRFAAGQHLGHPAMSAFPRMLECAPGQVEVGDLTGCAGLSKDESHGQVPTALTDMNHP